MSIKQVKSTCTCQSKNNKEETGMSRGRERGRRKGGKEKKEGTDAVEVKGGAEGGWGGLRCCQTSGRSLHSCHSQVHCASCRVFLLPRLCGGTSAICAAPETVCPARRCWGWSSAWLGVCPCCQRGETHKTHAENRLIVWEKHAGIIFISSVFLDPSIHTPIHSHAFLSHAITSIK